MNHLSFQFLILWPCFVSHPLILFIPCFCSKSCHCRFSRAIAKILMWCEGEKIDFSCLMVWCVFNGGLLFNVLVSFLSFGSNRWKRRYVGCKEKMMTKENLLIWNRKWWTFFYTIHLLESRVELEGRNLCIFHSHILGLTWILLVLMGKPSAYSFWDP